MIVEEVPVVIFEMEERTKELSVLCFKSLGFKNIIVLDQEESFADKMSRFFNIALSDEFKEQNLFIRSDADRLVFDGIKEMVEKSHEALLASDNGFVLSEGSGYECFMKKLRGATPHVYSKNLIKHIIENQDTLVKDIQKPESHIGTYCKEKINCFYFFDLLTNLHEFEQYPLKMYNAFLNRIHRGHLGYYNLNEITSDNFYGQAMKLAIDSFSNNSKEGLSLSYTKDDLKILLEKDEELGPINNLEHVYDHYKRQYDNLKQRYFKNV